MAAVVGRDGIHHIKGLSCDLCGQPCRTDEQTDLNSLTCTYSQCPDESSVYHQDCLDKYLKKIGLERNRRTGFKCPRGSGKGTRYPVTCPGRIDKSHPIHHRNEVAKQAAKASRETLPQKLNTKLEKKPSGKKAAAVSEKKSAPVPMAKPASAKVRQPAAAARPSLAAPAAVPASSASDLKARVVAERQGLKYHSMTNALPVGKASAARLKDLRPRKAAAPARQQTTLLAALEATTVQPAGRPRSRMALAGFGQPEAAKPGVPLHTGPAARMAAEAAAAKSQAPVGLETEDSVDDKLTKTQRRLMRRSERRAAQRAEPELPEDEQSSIQPDLDREDIPVGEELPCKPTNAQSAQLETPALFVHGMTPTEESLQACLKEAQSPDAEVALSSPQVSWSPSPQLKIPELLQEPNLAMPEMDVSPTLSKAAPENIVIGMTEPAGGVVSAQGHAEAGGTLQEALVLAEARRLMEQLQQIGFPAWQAAAAVQHSGADLEHGITFLLEGRLESKAAAYRFLEAAGAHLPNIDVSELMQQVGELATAFSLDPEVLEAAVLEADGNIVEGLSRLMDSSSSSSQHSSPSQSHDSPSFDSPLSSSLGRSSSLYASQGPSSCQPSPARSGLLATSLPRPSFELPSYESSPRIPHHSSPNHSQFQGQPQQTASHHSPLYPRSDSINKPPPMFAVLGDQYQYQPVYGFPGAPELPHTHFPLHHLRMDPAPSHLQQLPLNGAHRPSAALPTKSALGGAARVDAVSQRTPFGVDLSSLSAYPGDFGGHGAVDVPQAALLAAAAIASEPEMTRLGDPLLGEAGRAQHNQDLTSLVAALTCR